jgi:hypothetical protein
MKKIGIVLLLIFVSKSYLVVGSIPMDCREIYYDEVKYCSVSFYELLANSKKFDGLNIRIVGYLKHDSEGTLLSIDEVSLKGSMILDNVIGVHINKKMKEIYLEHNGKLVMVFGRYSNVSHRYTLARGEFEEVTLIEPHR